jgi:hypothetical protein
MNTTFSRYGVRGIARASGYPVRGRVRGGPERGTDDRPILIKTSHVPNVKRRTLAPEVRTTVESGATIYTDPLKSYLGLSDAYNH